MATKKFRGPGLLGWAANESEYNKREAERRRQQREQMSDRRPKAKPEKPKSWSAEQMEAASQALSGHASKTHNLNFKDKPQAKPQSSSSSPKPAATTSGGGRGASATPPASRPASYSASRPSSTPSYSAAKTSGSPQTGDKAKDLETWRKANPKLAEALDKRNAERGTSKSTNPQMADMLDRIKAREEGSKSQERLGDKAPNGKEYAGPAGGPSSTPSNSGNKKPSEDTKSNYTSDSITNSKVKLPDTQAKKGNSLPDNTKTAYSLAEELRKRRNNT
jgi:hypothetical protein